MTVSGLTSTLSPARRLALVRAVHDTPTLVVVAVAGGGNALITDLLDVGGASRTVLEIVVPYASTAMDDFVGPHAPAADTGAVSDSQVRAMAGAALARARSLAPEGHTDLLGLAITAALVSDRPKRGDHRAHVAVASPGPDDAPGDVAVDARFVEMVKGANDRRGEDRNVADVALCLLAEACGLTVDLPGEPTAQSR